MGNHHDKKVNGAEEADKKRYSSYSKPLATMQKLLSLLCLEVPENETFRSAWQRYKLILLNMMKN